MDTPGGTGTYRLFAPHERPAVLVRLDDGDEVEGELRAWKRFGDGWVGSVKLRRGPGHGTPPVTSRRTGPRRPPPSQARGMGSVTTIEWAVPLA